MTPQQARQALLERHRARRCLPRRPDRNPGTLVSRRQLAEHAPVWVTYSRRAPRAAVVVEDHGLMVLVRFLPEAGMPAQDDCLVGRERLQTRVPERLALHHR